MLGEAKVGLGRFELPIPPSSAVCFPGLSYSPGYRHSGLFKRLSASALLLYLFGLFRIFNYSGRILPKIDSSQD